MAGRKLVVEIVGDTKDLEKAFGRAEDKGKKFGSAMKVGLGAATAGLAGLGVAAKLGFDEFLDAQKVMAQTEAVLKSTGGAAKVTADDVTSLSEALMKKSGVDDEAIQSGENMLLTFTKIRNETGKGNDIFNQATKATLDLSVAMGKDMQSSAILVGKALNDPIKGMSALSKAGIQFTESQKDTIKAMVASGDAMGAQKMILKELETQFGGSAEAAGKTFSGQMNIAKQTALNFAGDVVAKVVPALADVVAFIQRNWPKIREIIEDVVNDVRALWKQWGDEIKAVVEFVFPVIEKMIKNTLKIIQGIIDVFVGTLTGDWSRAWDGIKAIVGGVLDNIETMLKAALTLLGAAAKKVGEAIFDGIKNAVDGIAGAVWDLVAGIGTKVGEMASTIVGWGTSVGSKIKNAAVDGIKGIGGAIWDLILEIGKKELEGIDIIKGWGTRAGVWIKDAAVNALKGIGQAVWNILLEIGKAELEAIDTVKGWGTQLATWLKDAVVDGLKGIGNAAWNVINNIWEFVEDRAEQVKGWGRKIGTWIKDAIVGAIEGIGGAIWDKVRGGLESAWDKATGWIPKGTELGPRITGPPAGVTAGLGSIASIGAQHGLMVTSGYRPGDPGDHGRGKALDISNTYQGDPDGTPQMDAAFLALAASSVALGIKDLLYEPGFWKYGFNIDNGRRAAFTVGGHGDHIHASVFDQGGILKPGLTLAYNGTGRNEYISRNRGGGTVINVTLPNYLGNERDVARALRDELRALDRVDNGGRTFGSRPALT